MFSSLYVTSDREESDDDDDDDDDDGTRSVVNVLHPPSVQILLLDYNFLNLVYLRENVNVLHFIE